MEDLEKGFSKGERFFQAVSVLSHGLHTWELNEAAVTFETYKSRNPVQKAVFLN